MNPVPTVLECTVTGPTSVRLRFQDNWSGILDLRPALKGPVFRELAQADRFRQVSVRGGTLVWPNGAEFCPTVLRYWCELGRVCSQEELDEHFVQVLQASTVTPGVAETKARYARKRQSNP